jgi:hypothetical protein
VIRKSDEVLEKLVKAVESRHSGQAKRDPESRIFGQLWIPACAGMTKNGLSRLFAKPANVVVF